MRLWHQQLIKHLPRQQLLGQHRECAAMRGNGWGKKHSTVDYAWKHGPAALAKYHQLIIQEMKRRGMSPDPLWEDLAYRGKCCYEWHGMELLSCQENEMIYNEHNDKYLEECLQNLGNKGHNLRPCLYTL